jgi:hypothetical protein
MGIQLLAEGDTEHESASIRYALSFATFGDINMLRYHFRIIFTDGATKENWVFADSRVQAFSIIASAFKYTTIRSIEILQVTD